MAKQIKDVTIFLSYAIQDEKKVETLYQRLSEIGLKPWMAAKDILPGEDWKKTISKVIKDAHFILICLSSNSVHKRGIIQEEIKQAIQGAEAKIEGDIYLIPVKLEECDVPDQLNHLQWVDLYSDPEKGFEKLQEAISTGMENLDISKKKGFLKLPKDESKKSSSKSKINSQTKKIKNLAPWYILSTLILLIFTIIYVQVKDNIQDKKYNTAIYKITNENKEKLSTALLDSLLKNRLFDQPLKADTLRQKFSAPWFKQYKDELLQYASDYYEVSRGGIALGSAIGSFLIILLFLLFIFSNLQTLDQDHTEWIDVARKSFRQLIKGWEYVGLTWLLLYAFVSCVWIFDEILVIPRSIFGVVADLFNLLNSFAFFYIFLVMDMPSVPSKDNPQRDHPFKKAWNGIVFTGCLCLLISLPSRIGLFQDNVIGSLPLASFCALSMTYFVGCLDSYYLEIKRVMLAPLYLYAIYQVIGPFLIASEGLTNYLDGYLLGAAILKTYLCFVIILWFKEKSFQKYIKFASERVELRRVEVE